MNIFVQTDARLKIYILLILCLYAILTAAWPSTAQEPLHYNINTENGLPDDEVYQVAQDKDGLMYIGCNSGLYRYDGFHFTTIKSEIRTGRSISHLHFDRKGTLWCQNFTGQIFYVNHDSLIEFGRFTNKNMAFPPFCIDQSGAVWVCHKQQLLVYPNGNKKASIILDIPYQDPIVQDIFPNGNEILISIAGHGIHSAELKSGKIHLSRIKNQSEDLNNLSTLNQFYGDVKNSFILSVKHPELETSIYNTKNLEKPIANIDSKILEYRIFNLQNINSTELWVSTSNGIYVFNKTTGQITEKPIMMNGIPVSSVFEDREKNLWLTSLGYGISLITDRNTTRINFSGKQKDIVTAVMYWNIDTIIAGTLQGEINMLHPENAGIKKELLVPGGRKKDVRKLIKYKNYLLAANGSLTIFEPKSGKSWLHRTPTIRDMVLVDDKLFAVTSTGTFVYYLNEFNPSILPPYKLIHAEAGVRIVSDSLNNSLWALINTGVIRIGIPDSADFEIKSSNIHGYCITIFKNKPYVITMNQEIVRLDYNKAQINGKSIQFSVSDDEYYYLHASKDRLLIYTKNNLYFTDLIDNKSSIIEKRPWFIQGIKQIASVNNNYYIASSSGLYSYKYPNSGENVPATDVIISGLWINGDEVEVNNRIETMYGNTVKLKLRSISFKSGRFLKYHYRIREIHSGWNSLSAVNPVITFNALAPGEYHFEAFSTDIDGNISKNSLRIKIIILGPYWQQWWFYVILFSILITLLIVAYTLRIRWIRRKAKREQAIILSQLTALKAQMNPHFMFNALNSIQQLVSIQDVKSSNYYLTQFSTLMRRVLSASDKEEITVAEEIEILRLYLELEKLRFGDEFYFEINTKDDIQPDDDKIHPMLLQPYVENAIKHGLLHRNGMKQLVIEFSHVGEYLECTITDNGIGRRKSTEINAKNNPGHTSFATQANHKRLALINDTRSKKSSVVIEDLLDADGDGLGTKVIIKY
jgi:ligand-binding sensor domain-containing protein/two-component sensor histidine kinase